jgi:hypothetical protein
MLTRDLWLVDLNIGLGLAADGHHAASRLDRVRGITAVHDQQCGP